MLIAITGVDGAGKSTVTAAATERLNSMGQQVRRVDRWDIVDNPTFPTARFLKSDIKDIRSCIAEMPNTARLLFLLWSMSMSLEAGCREWPRTQIKLLDGYWMKHAASEIAYGLDAKWVNQVVAGLPSPDLVIYLRVSPEQVWLRKRGALVPYECGMDSACSEESFLTHQYRIHRLLDAWSEEFGWTVVDASLPISDVVSNVIERLLGTLSKLNS